MPPDLPGLHQSYARGDLLAWAGLAVMLGAGYLAARLLTGFGLWVASAGWRRPGDEHWTERARRCWPGRRLVPLVPILVPVPLLFRFIFRPLALTSPGRAGPFDDLLPHPVTAVLFLAVGFLGVMQTSAAWERRVNPAVALTPWPRLATLTFWALTLAFWIWLPLALGVRVWIHRGDLELAFVGGGLLLLLIYRLGGGWLLLRWTGIRRSAPDRLRTVVEALAERMGIRPRSVEVTALPCANALAYPVSGRIAVTDAALAVLDDGELSAVCAHELAHLAEPRRVTVARFLYSLMLVAAIALVVLPVSLLDRIVTFEAGLALCVGFDVLFLGGVVAYSRLHHRMEVRADAMACAFEGEPGTYARALEKIHEASAIPVVARADLGQYPELYDRMIASGLAPDYPRPAPPRLAPFYVGLLLLIAGAIAGGFGLALLAAAIE